MTPVQAEIERENAAWQRRLLGVIADRLDIDTSELDADSLVKAERMASDLARRLMAESWGRRTGRRVPSYGSHEWHSFFTAWMNSPSED